ncbi:hypothetical protein E34_1557 [Lactococcus lactis subsp. lactis]|uniref:DUF1642 domain-containing protein n=1 Tax=Lactococcus lactis TaxID=1358 RepID=UPI00071D4CCB|nr:DUF1642 domain-containing protein [Lactococcus lactis]KST78034.1 hypothetical protein E34_1557 [Lactococcus lactis subsp. lactis]
MTKFEEEFNYLIELSGKVLIGQVDAEAFEKNRIAFFEKYETDQQQALPVVPERVADYISELKEKGHGIQFGLMCSTHDSFGEGNEKAIHWKDDNAEDFARAWLDGYTVEKPQLFYLKNKLTGDCLAICLARASSGLYVEVTEKWLTRKEQTSYKLYFTQQEIDSMETGSYEQIEVAE